MKFLNIKLKTLAHICGGVWLCSIVAFFGLAFFLRSTIYSNTTGTIYLAILILGVLSFALAVVLYFLHFVNNDKAQTKNKTRKNISNNSVFKKLTIGLSVIVVLLLIALFAKNTNFILGTNEEQVQKPPVEVTNVPTPTAIPAYVDPDPIVSCTSSYPNCLGKSISLKRSECSNITCCGIGDKWIIYATVDSCKQAQTAQVPTNNQQQNSNSSSKIPVFLSYYGYTINCPSQNVAAVQAINSSMESKHNSWDTAVGDCSTRFYSTDSCYVACKAGDINVYGDCIKKCPQPNQCYSIYYAERDILKSQIDNLCK